MTCAYFLMTGLNRLSALVLILTSALTPENEYLECNQGLNRLSALVLILTDKGSQEGDRTCCSGLNRLSALVLILT